LSVEIRTNLPVSNRAAAFRLVHQDELRGAHSGDLPSEFGPDRTGASGDEHDPAGEIGLHDIEI
jgi:hypothetical protein